MLRSSVKRPKIYRTTNKKFEKRCLRCTREQQNISV